MIKSMLISLTLLVLLSVPAAADKVIICGTGDSQNLLRTLAAVYEKSHPGTTIDVPDSIGSSGGIKAAAEGKCDLGRIARPLKEKETSLNLTYMLFARSPVAFVSHPEHTGAKDLTYEQITGIYSGVITKWSDVGGADAKMYIADREEGDSSRSILEKHVPGFKNIANRAGKTIFSTPETLETVTQYPGTIAYLPLAMVKGTKLVTMSINGVYPTKENVLNGRYALTVPFAMVYKGVLSEQGRAFLAFLFSDQAQSIIMENGAVPADK